MNGNINNSLPELEAFKRAPSFGLSQWENGNLTTNLAEKKNTNGPVRFQPEDPSPKEAISRLSNKVPQLPSGAPTSPQLDGMGAVYCQDVDIAEIVPSDSESKRGVRSYAIDPAGAKRLWSLSERLTGVKFPTI